MFFHLRKARVSSDEEFESDYGNHDPEENPSKEEEEKNEKENDNKNEMEPPKYLNPLCAYLGATALLGFTACI